jgi:hypothetical protein
MQTAIVMLMARAGLIWLAGLAVTGCQPGQLYVASDTVLGLNANVNTARDSGRFQFGYDRYFATVIPRSADVANGINDTGLTGGEQGREVMAIIGCSDVEVSGIFLSKFVESLATGRAARGYAKQLADNPPNAASSFACFNAQ